MGSAQTGTGKTAAFAIPIIQHLSNEPQHNSGKRKISSLIITPTRELAIQIGESFTTYAKYTTVKNTVIFGGVTQGSQTTALGKGVDVLVATPGRLLDLMDQGYISLKDVKYFVLDEADRMLDMGFIHDIKRIQSSLPRKKQSLMFSATFSQEIRQLATTMLYKPMEVDVAARNTAAKTVTQQLFPVDKKDKTELLSHLYEELKRLKKENSRQKEEIAILKKAAAYFAKEAR